MKRGDSDCGGERADEQSSPRKQKAKVKNKGIDYLAIARNIGKVVGVDLGAKNTDLLQEHDVCTRTSSQQHRMRGCKHKEVLTMAIWN